MEQANNEWTFQSCAGEEKAYAELLGELKVVLKDVRKRVEKEI